MKSSIVSAALCACLGLGVAVGCSSQADHPTDQRDPTTKQLGDVQGYASGYQSAANICQSAVVVSDAQARLAQATMNLEKAFSEQWISGEIQRERLAEQIDRVMREIPLAAQARVQEHIDRILAISQRLALRISREVRAQMACAASLDTAGHLEWGLVSSWGWPTFAGFGGLGAFGFPGIFSVGFPVTAGFTDVDFDTISFTDFGSNDLASCAWGGCFGLGAGGWFW